ncbi:SpaH/EbpB family LPXTG-anchored major pilin [Lacticaseibacillus suibinensis]|uniref:SpaH/EbpB family LPXTG-anchored major pilin n=1 Tax=Lacticaseibacillus suibinensis TaxID=2486011 RepID=UPI000F7B3BE2|nr:SpaH/EbpB family LPXTG-anchored major pilin [Lacticaseibacillus suibinensis]
MTKLIKGLITAALGLLVVAGLSKSATPVTVAADSAPTEVTVVLHKLLFDQSLPLQQQNKGITEPTFEQDSKPLNGVTFTVYDVTADFWDNVKQVTKGDVEQAQANLAGDDYQPTTKAVHSQDTAGQGEATFANLPVRSGSQYAVYLFKETNQPAGIENDSQNLVVVMPGNIDQGIQSRIDLFPKNKMVSGYSTVEKTITNYRTNFSYGEAIPYQIAVKVPANIGAMTNFKLTDTADARLERVGGLTVKVDGQNAAGRFTTTQDDAQAFALSFDPAKLIEFANKTITVTYQMRIKQGTTPDVPLINRTVLYPDDSQPQTDMAVVVTGGKRFEKIDAKAHQTKLQGATFLVKNAKGQYLVQGEHGWLWRPVAGDPVTDYQSAGLYTLVSAKDGRFALAGLKAGAYNLVEVKAPKGYQRSTKTIPFMVVAGEYTRGQASPYAVVNVKTPEPPVPPKTPKTPGTPSILQRIIPKLGSEGAAWLSIMGLILIALIFAFRVKNKKA